MESKHNSDNVQADLLRRLLQLIATKKLTESDKHHFDASAKAATSSQTTAFVHFFEAAALSSFYVLKRLIPDPMATFMGSEF